MELDEISFEEARKQNRCYIRNDKLDYIEDESLKKHKNSKNDKFVSASHLPDQKKSKTYHGNSMHGLVGVCMSDKATSLLNDLAIVRRIVKRKKIEHNVKKAIKTSLDILPNSNSISDADTFSFVAKKEGKERFKRVPLFSNVHSLLSDHATALESQSANKRLGDQEGDYSEYVGTLKDKIIFIHPDISELDSYVKTLTIHKDLPVYLCRDNEGILEFDLIMTPDQIRGKSETAIKNYLQKEIDKHHDLHNPKIILPTTEQEMNKIMYEDKGFREKLLGITGDDKEKSELKNNVSIPLKEESLLYLLETILDKDSQEHSNAQKILFKYKDVIINRIESFFQSKIPEEFHPHVKIKDAKTLEFSIVKPQSLTITKMEFDLSEALKPDFIENNFHSKTSFILGK